jgi:hypothetical protein
LLWRFMKHISTGKSTLQLGRTQIVATGSDNYEQNSCSSNILTTHLCIHVSKLRTSYSHAVLIQLLIFLDDKSIRRVGGNRVDMLLIMTRDIFTSPCPTGCPIGL